MEVNLIASQIKVSATKIFFSTKTFATRTLLKLFSYHELLIRLLSSFCVALCEVALLTASTAAAAAKMAA